MSGPVRVVVADDQEVVRAGLAERLFDAVRVVAAGEAVVVAYETGLIVRRGNRSGP